MMLVRDALALASGPVILFGFATGRHRNASLESVSELPLDDADFRIDERGHDAGSQHRTRVQEAGTAGRPG